MIDFRSYGGWEVLQSVISKLEVQKSWWYNSVQVHRPENQENQWCQLPVWGQRPESQGDAGVNPRVWTPDNSIFTVWGQEKTDVSAQKKRTRIYTSFAFFILGGDLKRLHITPNHFGEDGFSLLSLI